MAKRASHIDGFTPQYDHPQVPMTVGRCGIHVDAGVTDLIAAMNKIEGICTRFSCQGDSRPDQIGRAYVCFKGSKKRIAHIFKTLALQIVNSAIVDSPWDQEVSLQFQDCRELERWAWGAGPGWKGTIRWYPLDYKRMVEFFRNYADRYPKPTAW